VTEVHWRIIANLGFKCPIPLYRALAAVLLADAVLLAVLLAGESSRAMLASARVSCLIPPGNRHVLPAVRRRRVGGRLDGFRRRQGTWRRRKSIPGP